MIGYVCHIVLSKKSDKYVKRKPKYCIAYPIHNFIKNSIVVSIDNKKQLCQVTLSFQKKRLLIKALLH
jgi:hypothetical protein